MERYKNVGVPDHSGWSNQALFFTRQLWNMLVLARVITIGALLRDESRGAHYKPDFPERDDARFLKTTLARFAGPTDAPEISYEEVDIQYIKPRPRRYDVAKEAAAAHTGRRRTRGRRPRSEPGRCRRPPAGRRYRRRPAKYAAVTDNRYDRARAGDDNVARA